MSSTFCKICLTILHMKNIFDVRLTDLLKENNLSKRELGKQTKISAQSISDWSTGKVQPTAENIYVLAKFFGVSTDYMLGISDDFTPVVGIDYNLDEKEERLLKAFRLLNNLEKGKLIEDAEFYARRKLPGLEKWK